jgi:hypothetical protein
MRVLRIKYIHMQTCDLKLTYIWRELLYDYELHEITLKNKHCAGGHLRPKPAKWNMLHTYVVPARQIRTSVPTCYAYMELMICIQKIYIKRFDMYKHELQRTVSILP